jgi:hypothetical protein
MFFFCFGARLTGLFPGNKNLRGEIFLFRIKKEARATDEAALRASMK